ncbi:pilus assembly protein TadG-related protein [Sphingomicrobium sp. XHP0239]|uniref:pilus assembly protein TadG-related protein n=1 Tax=Sphingomicrobium maritimum TaxID=3133972 RepID=UPI0031CC71E7
MRKLFSKVWNDETGNVLVIMGATLPLLVGAAGIATDTVQWTLWKRQLQRAADSAAIAGVYERIEVGDNVTKVEGAVGRDLTLNHHTGIALHSGFPKTQLLADDGTKVKRVKVALQVSRPLSFSGMFMKSAPDIYAEATAASVPGTDAYCVISLEDTAETGITGSGNAGVEMDCGMITNSIATNSAIAKGSVMMKASVIASVGGIQKSDNWIVNKYDPYVSAMVDPYKNINPDPNDMKCDGARTVVKGGKNVISTDPVALTPANYDKTIKTPGGDSVNCYTSLSVAPGETLALDPGVYYINGGDIDIKGTVTGTNVTLVLTNKDPSSTKIGNFTMNAGEGTLDIDAPDSGTYKGIAVMQDRRAPLIKQNNKNRVNGGGSGDIIGALYFPKQAITYNGDGNMTAVCTRFVTRRIVFTGNSTVSNKFKKDCGGDNVDTFEGGRLIRLVA